MGLLGKSGVVGLEMDTGIIRGVEVSGGQKVVAAGQVVLPETAVVDGMVQDVEAVATALNTLWTQSRFTTRNVALGMFNQGVMLRLINFPQVPKDKLRQAIQIQAGDYFPIPVSQMVLDYAVVGQAPGDDGTLMEILLVAAKKDQLYLNLEALSRSRLTPMVIDASPLALMKVLPEDKLTGTTVVVDLANGLSSLLLAIDGMPRFARVMSVSLRQYTEGLAGYLFPKGDLRDEAAVGAEQNLGDKVFSKWSVSVANDIRASISYYVKQDSLSGVDRIILSGKGAKAIGLAEMLHEELDVPIEVINPFSLVKAKGDLGFDWDLDGPNFATCVGLALRGLEV